MPAIPLGSFKVYAKAQIVHRQSGVIIGKEYGDIRLVLDGVIVHPEPFYFDYRAMLEMRIRQLMESKIMFEAMSRLRNTPGEALFDRVDWTLDITEYSYERVVPS